MYIEHMLAMVELHEAVGEVRAAWPDMSRLLAKGWEDVSRPNTETKRYVRVFGDYGSLQVHEHDGDVQITLEG